MYYERKLEGAGYCRGAHEHIWIHPDDNKKMLNAIMANDDAKFKALMKKYNLEE